MEKNIENNNSSQNGLPGVKPISAFEAILERTSIRSYLSSPVEYDKLSAILESATHPPNSGNLQSFRFIVVLDKEKKKELADCTAQPDIINSAPLGIIVCALEERAETYYPEKGKFWVTQDCAAAIENMLITATSLGLGSCWIGEFDREKVRMLFSIPDGSAPHAIITLGYPDEKPVKKRDPLETFIYFNKYGNTLKNINLVLREFSAEWKKQAKGLTEQSASILRKTAKKTKEAAKKTKEAYHKKYKHKLKSKWKFLKKTLTGNSEE